MHCYTLQHKLVSIQATLGRTQLRATMAAAAIWHCAPMQISQYSPVYQQRRRLTKLNVQTKRPQSLWHAGVPVFKVLKVQLSRFVCVSHQKRSHCTKC